jgi:uncharacterized protein (TIGR03086 family)
MSEISERYGRLAADFASTVDAVPADRWNSPSPCEGWDARDVVRHVVGNCETFEGFIGGSLGDIPSVDDDPSGAFKAASAVVLRDLEDPARATAGFDGFFGPSTFEQAVDRFASFDLLIHRWDLGRAAGIDVRMHPADVRWADDKAKSFGDMIRTDGVCGPEVEAPAGADEQAKLLAYLGRQP